MMFQGLDDALDWFLEAQQGVYLSASHYDDIHGEMEDYIVSAWKPTVEYCKKHQETQIIGNCRSKRTICYVLEPRIHCKLDMQKAISALPKLRQKLVRAYVLGGLDDAVSFARGKYKLISRGRSDRPDKPPTKAMVQEAAENYANRVLYSLEDTLVEMGYIVRLACRRAESPFAFAA